MTKIYGIYGYREVNIRIPLGNGRNFMQREFTRGNPQQGAYYRPATYVSSDKTEQNMIESSPMFGRQIKLIRTCGETTEQEVQTERQQPKRQAHSSRGPIKVVEQPKQEPVAEPESDAAQEDDAAEIHDEITTREELIAFLKSQGAKATVLASNDKMAQFIADRNLSFPNLNM